MGFVGFIYLFFLSLRVKTSYLRFQVEMSLCCKLMMSLSVPVCSSMVSTQSHNMHVSAQHTVPGESTAL